jgi:bacterial low temperature requirement A protein (ltrA)
LSSHKKVELTELFYDLVFVYGLSRETALLHHTHNGHISAHSFLAFSIGMIIMINSWMVQTVFTSRFGKNSLKNNLFMFGQMILILMSMSSVTGEFTRENFIYFYSSFTGISMLLLLQYVLEYRHRKKPADKQWIKRFVLILSLRSLALFVSLFLPHQVGIIFASLSVLFTWLLPIIFLSNKEMNQYGESTPVNIPHIMERLSLLVIITFGEMLSGVAGYFSIENITISSILVFTIVVGLFISYITEIEQLFDTKTPVQALNLLSYFHYPIVFGLSLITVSFEMFHQQEVTNLYTVSLIYLGLLLFLLGLFGLQKFNKKNKTFGKPFLTGFIVSLATGFGLSLLFLENITVLFILLSLVATFWSLLLLKLK